MQTLVIDTSYGSTVGVVGHEPIVETDSRTHVEKLQVNIAQAVEQNEMKASDITRIVVGVGPAPFTGLRAGIVFEAEVKEMRVDKALRIVPADKHSKSHTACDLCSGFYIHGGSSAFFAVRAAAGRSGTTSSTPAGKERTSMYAGFASMR